MELRITAPNGRDTYPDDPVATGMVLLLLHPQNGVTDEVHVIVKGDVLGTGRLDISQLVRMARAIKGEEPLEGPYLEAGKWTGNDHLSIADLVQQARLLQSQHN